MGCGCRKSTTRKTTKPSSSSSSKVRQVTAPLPSKRNTKRVPVPERLRRRR